MRTDLSRSRRRPRREQRGMVLLVVMMMILVLFFGGTFMVSVAGTDLEISASGRRQVITFSAADGAVAEVLSDARITLDAASGGFAPDPGSLDLVEPYTPIVQPDGTTYNATVRYLRQGPAFESSALEVRSLVYEVSAEARYSEGGARSPVTAEFYRLAPVVQGHTPRPRHYH